MGNGSFDAKASQGDDDQVAVDGAFAPTSALQLGEVFKDWKFFLPPPEVTRNILRLNREFGEDYCARREARLIEREGSIVEAEDDFKTTEDVNWLQTIADQVAEILFHGDAEKERPSMSPDEAIGFFPKFIAERIYNHLAMLSRSAHVKNGDIFSIREELTVEIAGRIGLGLYLSKRTPEWLRQETEVGLNDLAYEFQDWLVNTRKGVYTATWGVICSAAKAREVVDEGISTKPLIMEPDVVKKVIWRTAPAAAQMGTG